MHPSITFPLNILILNKPVAVFCEKKPFIFVKKEALAQMFPFEFCKIFKNTLLALLTKHLRMNTSKRGAAHWSVLGEIFFLKVMCTTYFILSKIRDFSKIYPELHTQMEKISKLLFL